MVKIEEKRNQKFFFSFMIFFYTKHPVDRKYINVDR